MKFHLSINQQKKLTEWLKVLDEKTIQIQKEQMIPEEWEELTCNGKYPYYGTSSGGVEYKFIPTGLGIILKVKHLFTGEEIDLTEYDYW